MTYGSMVNMVVAYSVMVTPVDDIRVVGQVDSCLYCNCIPWMTYGSLVRWIVAYSVMVTPMGDIWVNGQHGCCL